MSVHAESDVSDEVATTRGWRTWLRLLMLALLTAGCSSCGRDPTSRKYYYPDSTAGQELEANFPINREKAIQLMGKSNAKGGGLPRRMLITNDGYFFPSRLTKFHTYLAGHYVDGTDGTVNYDNNEAGLCVVKRGEKAVVVTQEEAENPFGWIWKLVYWSFILLYLFFIGLVLFGDSVQDYFQPPKNGEKP